MKTLIRAVALAMAVVAVGFWYVGGANPGWTKNRIQVKSIDPVTEIEQVEWQDKFIPGVDLLGGGLIAAGVLFVGSLFIRKQNKQQQTQHS